MSHPKKNCVHRRWATIGEQTQQEQLDLPIRISCFPGIWKKKGSLSAVAESQLGADSYCRKGCISQRFVLLDRRPTFQHEVPNREAYLPLPGALPSYTCPRRVTTSGKECLIMLKGAGQARSHRSCSTSQRPTIHVKLLERCLKSSALNLLLAPPCATSRRNLSNSMSKCQPALSK